MGRLRFYIAWLFASLIMFAAFYTWHGLFLNDFIKFNYPPVIFFSSASIAYLFMGLCMTLGFEAFTKRAVERKPFFKSFRKSETMRGWMCGLILGFIFFVLTLVLGVSFSKELTLKALTFDLTWQLIEQSLGGVVVGWVYLFYFIPEENFMEAREGVF